MEQKPTIGFIGLGIMGAPMAAHLLRAGHDMLVYNRTPSKMEPLIALGAKAGKSCRDVAERSDVVISMVPDSPDVEKVYLGEKGVLEGVKPGMLLIDMSTISPVTAVIVSEAAAKKGCQMLDAPVSGGDVGAKKATLSIMVGGDPEAYEQARPIFELMGTPTLCGPSGAGQTVKACNQIQVALNFIGMAEALVLGAKAGVDPAIVVKVLSGGYAQSRVMDVRGPRVIKGDYEPGFRSRFHYKDLNIIRETARAFGCSLPASALAHELFSAMQANGWGDLDHSAVIKVVESLSNVEVRTGE
ncbi:MAG: 2-hydroxy-3-oxopropionate reductase [Chloroflexota bacterium]|nr:2-hydroxy-3-oxopropionate reductase [Anaerolineae bacterium]